MPGVEIVISDNADPYWPFHCGDDYFFEIETDSLGEFDFNFESECDSEIYLRLSDSLRTIYNRCSRWEIIDLNENPFNEGISQDFGTHRGRDYDFDVRLQPVIYLDIQREQNENLEFDSIAIPDLNVFVDSLSYLYGRYHLDLTEDIFEGSITIEVFYRAGQTEVFEVEYDYLKDCTISQEIQI